MLVPGFIWILILLTSAIPISKTKNNNKKKKSKWKVTTISKKASSDIWNDKIKLVYDHWSWMQSSKK